MMSQWKLIPIAAIALWLSGCLSMGCEAMNSGPRMMERVVEVGGATASTLLATYQPTQTQASVEGSINDPRYRVKMFAGTGVYFDTIMSLEGADLRFNVVSAGEGRDIDDSFRKELLSIIGRGDLAEEAKQKAIMDVITRWMLAKAEAVVPPPGGTVTTPTTQPTNEGAGRSGPPAVSAAGLPTQVPPSVGASVAAEGSAEHETIIEPELETP